MKHWTCISILVIGIGISLVLGCKRRDASAQTAQTDPIGIETVELETALSIHPPVMQADEFTALVAPSRPPQDITLPCRRMQQTPTIDGIAEEVWQTIQPVTTLDASSQRPIQLKAFHNGQSIFILATYPDSAPSQSHKSWFWDAQEKVYKPGNDREDMFVLKWKMTGDELSFSPNRVAPHVADIWFWKACRTDPAGYLDDKRQEVTVEEKEGATQLPSNQYGTLYLKRIGDAGKSAYEEKMFFEYQGQVLSKYYSRIPQGSRADVRGKGHWQGGQWTIEIQRPLDTGHPDDIRFVPGQSYVFAASLYEMAGVGIDPDWFQPLYKTGNMFDQLTLQIEE